VRIETEAACRAAVTAAGKYVGSLFVYPDSYYPRGCYYITSSNNANFNTHAVGAGDSGRQLLCAAGAPLTPLTPLRAPLRARARVHRSCMERRKGAHRVLQGYSKGTHTVLRTLRRTSNARLGGRTRVGGGRRGARRWCGSSRQYAAAHGTRGQSM
jgi:hypothetical protein